MEPKLLRIYETEKAIVRIYTGPMTETREQRRELLEMATLNYAKAVRKSNPEVIEEIDRRIRNHE